MATTITMTTIAILIRTLVEIGEIGVAVGVGVGVAGFRLFV